MPAQVPALRYRPFRGRLRQYRLLDSDNDADEYPRQPSSDRLPQLASLGAGTFV